MGTPSSRQAVLLIHGIGEQRPMSTLREFVTAVVGENFKSRPHDLSDSLELRRLVYNSKPDDWSGVETCFFEYYWAYRFRDTKWRHIFDWAWLLLWNRPKNIPRRLKPI